MTSVTSVLSFGALVLGSQLLYLRDFSGPMEMHMARDLATLSTALGVSEPTLEGGIQRSSHQTSAASLRIFFPTLSFPP